MANVTKEWAIQYAQTLFAEYSALTSVQAIIDQAVIDNKFKNNSEMMAVWGKLHRLVGAK